MITIQSILDNYNIKLSETIYKNKSKDFLSKPLFNTVISDFDIIQVAEAKEKTPEYEFVLFHHLLTWS